MWRGRTFDISPTAQHAQMVGEELSRIDTQFRRRMRLWLGVLVTVWVVSLLAVLVALSARPAYADELPLSVSPPTTVIIVSPPAAAPPADQPEPPLGARRWRYELMRAANTVWGLDAPVAVFAAQVEQESGWRPWAVSRVGAVGMGQFMPATASWWCRMHKMNAQQCQPRNPVWSLRALVGYDRWIWDQIGRIPGAEEMDPYSRMWATLRSYNGGLGHWRAESRAAGSLDRLAVDAACGRARRHRSHCRENLGYPQRIMVTLQPRYAGWGAMVELAGSGGER
ncbi:transglycosylase SLT domain-containing protein [uncultured Sphaerotilus sp.]|uniref:transglycosylase SLT domain-containing protein n=1 Tax=uncultured Sphaerotilus sp. TaxID=474984 RepID=UPI0030CA3A5B